MRSVSTITSCKRIIFFGLLFLTVYTVRGQENSPYSRFGLGDLLPGQNITNRAMGGAAVTYFDPLTVNFLNPASYARLKFTTFDIGLDYSARTLLATDPVRSQRSSYLVPSYVQIGLPLSRKNNWGMNFGIRPVSRINYLLNQKELLPGIDSVATIYKGDGGSYQAFVGSGIGSKNFTAGFNLGYSFGNKNYVNERVFLSDSVFYEKGKWSDSTHFGGLFLGLGAQYSTKLSKTTTLKLGGFAQLKSNLKATRNLRRETFIESATAGEVQRDSVYISSEAGKIVLPATYGFGIAIEKDLKWGVHAEYNITQWDDYRYYGEKDNVKDNWVLRIGGSMIPNYKSQGYWNQVQYRAGFYIGPDYIAVNKDLPTYAFTFGASFPVKKYGYQLYSGQYTSINTAFEIGRRGNKSNSLRENFYRISLGFSLSDVWFRKQKYD